MSVYSAQCQCGALRLNATVDPDMVVVCSCKFCQRRTGSPFGAAGYFSRDAISTTGEYRTWSRISDAGRDITNHFCPTCGSTLWWTLELKPDLIGVAVGTVDQPLPRPVRAVWAEAAHDWVAYPDDFTVFPKGSTGT